MMWLAAAPAPASLTLLLTFSTLNSILQNLYKVCFQCSFLAGLGSGIRIELKWWIQIQIQVNQDPQPRAWIFIDTETPSQD
jgi:hypothetical protein